MKLLMLKLNKKNTIINVFTVLAIIIVSFILAVLVLDKFDETFDDIEVQKMIAKRYDESKEYSKAFRWYKKAANRGDPLAQNNLGVLYQEGTGVKKNYRQAKKWYTKSAKQGYALAANNLGYLLETVDGNYTTAVEWYKIAISKGLSVSLNNLALKYQLGQGIPKDCKKALELFELAAGNETYYSAPNAQYNLGVLYETGCGEEVLPNYKAAIEWYKKASANGVTCAEDRIKKLEKRGF